VVGGGLIELVIGLVIFSIIGAAVVGALVDCWHLQLLRTAITRNQNTLRVALELLAVELRSLSPSLGDLYAIAPDSVALRSNTGLGTVCGASGDRLAIRRIWGAFGDARGDSILLFREGRHDRAVDDAWVAVAVREVRAGGTGACPDGAGPDLTLISSASLNGAEVGTPVRGFRPYVYRLYRSGDGNWWLGQRLRGGVIQPVTGPLLPPGRGGLRLEYRTRSGTAARFPAEVFVVLIRAVASSRVPVFRPGGPGFVVDSLSTLVYLRNS
jgi:hypothetical protein